MRIESNAFSHNDIIPKEYTCDGEEKQISLKFFGVPEKTKSLAIIIDDPDAPNGDFIHWIIWNIDPEVSIIDSNNIPKGAVEGYTSQGKKGYVAPCPLAGIHHYNFKLFALDSILSIPETSIKTDLINAMKGHIIENATLVGLYGGEDK